MLALFKARNTVVRLPSSLNSLNVIAMLLLVAGRVDRSLFADTVPDYGAYDFDSSVFQPRVLLETKI